MRTRRVTLQPIKGLTELTDAELISDGFMSVAQAAKWLGRSTSTVYDLMATGGLPYLSTRDEGGSRLIPRRGLYAWAAARLRRSDQGLAGRARLTVAK